MIIKNEIGWLEHGAKKIVVKCLFLFGPRLLSFQT